MTAETGFSQEQLESIGDNIDRLISLDIPGRGFVKTIYPYVRERHGRPLTLLAAEKLKERVGPGDIVLITCGMLLYPLRLAETDGPLGGAALARALQIGLGAKPLLVVDHDAVDMTKATCRGANLNVVDEQRLLETERTVGVIGFPIDEEEARREADRIFDGLKPKAIVAIECRGRNEKGVYHAVPKGRDMNHIAAKCATLFDKAKEGGVLTIGIGDGGNEIGWGIVADVIREKIPYGDQCVCGCGGGFGDVTETDVCVAASVSNWGAYGVIASLSALLGNPEVLQDTKIEARMLRECVDAGGVDGISSLPKPWVDGMPEEVDYSIVTLLHQIAFANFDWPEFAKR